MTTDPAASEIYAHADALDILHRESSLDQKLAAIHESLYSILHCVDRISVATYDPATDLLKTFLASSPGRSELVRYEARLADTASLREILAVGKPRLVRSLDLFQEGQHLHTKIIAEEGYHYSYTTPMYLRGAFCGFIFFNSRSQGPLEGAALDTLDVFAHLISALVTAELLSVRILTAALKTAHDMVHYRDPETGSHIDRMARYSRLIAQHLAATGSADLSDETIERIFQFAPLHDLGKLAIPDRILLKEGQLSSEERSQMQQHTLFGERMIKDIENNFDLHHIAGLELLEHIAAAHHEAMDGSGYPLGLHGEQIPLEARIIAVADIFDALTTARPYKVSWSNEEAFAWLRTLARTKLDERCVEALIYNAPKIKEIQAQFADEEQHPAPADPDQAAAQSSFRASLP